jgi:hypothetical protein
MVNSEVPGAVFSCHGSSFVPFPKSTCFVMPGDRRPK